LGKIGKVAFHVWIGLGLKDKGGGVGKSGVFLFVEAFS
jgi:hypothetical protein